MSDIAHVKRPDATRDFAESLEIVDSMAALPQGPGLGVEIDQAKVESYQVT